nr:PI-PLC X domain-containing protein 1-like [Dermatophagoides farinae]
MTRIVFIITIIVIQHFLSSHTVLSSDQSPFERLFNRFSDFLKDLKNPNDQHERRYHDRLKHYESQLSQTRVWLTISSVVNVTGHDSKDHNRDLLIRALEIHWRRPVPPQPGDYLAIYRTNDSVQIRTFPLIDTKTNRTFPRYYKSDLEFNYQNLTNLNKTDKDDPYENCLQYMVVYVNHHENIESRNCIRMQARWMEQLFERIKDHRLSELMIPGTHDASSYEKYSYDIYELDVLSRFQYTQDESLYNQLAYGIRYMDWRVAVYNQTNHTDSQTFNWIEEYWMVHDMQRNRITLKQAIRQVVKFLTRTTHEIIIIDFHRFVHGFDGENDLQAMRQRLQTFIDIIHQQLGPYLIPYSSKGLPTIGNLIARNQRVLICYAYKFDVRQLPDSIMLWPPVQHLWADTDKLIELESYIQEQICKPSRSFHNTHLLRSMMAELTPTVEGVLFRRYHGLREMAALVNMNYEQWFRYRWSNCTNIVAGDFFLGSDLIDISIDVNRERFQSS